MRVAWRFNYDFKTEIRKEFQSLTKPKKTELWQTKTKKSSTSTRAAADRWAAAGGRFVGRAGRGKHGPPHGAGAGAARCLTSISDINKS